MGLLKPLKDLAKDVKEGDLIRIFLENSDYVGYRWGSNHALVDGQLMLPQDDDILFCSLNPYGNTRMEGDLVTVTEGNNKQYLNLPIVTKKIQFVGVNLKTRTLGNEPIRGYLVLERTTHSED
jgi:hypothetical protein